MKEFPPWFFAILALVFLVNLLYMWRIIGTPKRLKRWLEGEGWKLETVSVIKKDSRFYESDTWWLFHVVATDLTGNRRKLLVRLGGVFQSLKIVEVEELAHEKQQHGD